MITQYAIGFVLGFSAASISYYVLKLHKRLDDIEYTLNTFPSPEDMAKKLLTMKMPIKDLPPDVREALREEATKQGVKTKIGDNSYIG